MRKNYKNKRRNEKTSRNQMTNNQEDRVAKPALTGTNDPSWYFSHPELLKSSANLNYNVPVGSVEDFYVNGKKYSITRPGIASFLVCPVIGNASKWSDPVNVAARKVYSFIRHANSGSRNYDTPDLMMYLLALDSAYIFHAYMRRLYGTARLFAVNNKYVGAAIVESEAVQYADLSANMARFRTFINQYAARLATLVAPADFTYYRRHYWMFSNVFKSSESRKAQINIFSPNIIYRFNGKGVTTLYPHILAKGYVANPTARYTVDQLIDYGNQILDDLLVQEDCGIMSGDILKAYGEDRIYKLPLVEEDYMVVPTYDEEAHVQMHNATLMGYVKFDTGLNITQNTVVGGGELRQTPHFEGWIPTCSKVVTFDKEDITPADTMVATRLMATVANATYDVAEDYVLGYTVPHAEAHTTLEYAGSEVVEVVCLWRTSPVNGQLTSLATLGDRMRTYYHVDEDLVIAHKSDVMGQIYRASLFEDLPLLGVFGVDPEGGTDLLDVSSFYTIYDVDNYCPISDETLAGLHEVAMLSMFNVPLLGLDG